MLVSIFPSEEGGKVWVEGDKIHIEYTDQYGVPFKFSIEVGRPLTYVGRHDTTGATEIQVYTDADKNPTLSITVFNNYEFAEEVFSTIYTAVMPPEALNEALKEVVEVQKQLTDIERKVLELSKQFNEPGLKVEKVREVREALERVWKRFAEKRKG